MAAEAKSYYVVNVMQDGVIHKVTQLAYTEYHAIELVFSRLRDKQPDRQEYNAKPARYAR